MNCLNWNERDYDFASIIIIHLLIEEKEKKRKKENLTFTKGQTIPLLLCGPSALLFSVKASVQEVRSHRGVTWEEYVLTIIV